MEAKSGDDIFADDDGRHKLFGELGSWQTENSR